MLMALFAPLAMNAQSTHSWGSSDTNSGSDTYANPFGRCYGYEYRVFLYPPNTMNGVSGNITKLEFLPDGDLSNGGQIDVWMKSVTNVSSLSSSNNFAYYKSGATHVYTSSSSPSFNQGNYVSLPLSESISYNYSNNEYLMILVRSVASSASGDGCRSFYYYNPANASDNTWYAKNDGSDPGENTVSGWGTMDTGAHLPVIRVTYSNSAPTPSYDATYTLNNNITQALTCGGHRYRFLDSGGENGEYSNNQNFTATFTCTGNITITFNSFAVESYTSNYDYLTLYDGETQIAKLGGAGSNISEAITMPISYTATSGTLKAVWCSDNSYTNAGWDATITTGACVSNYTVTTNVFPTGAGTVTGGGTIDAGNTTTLTASANTDYTFHHWELNGKQVSTSATYTTPAINSNVTYTAVYNVYSPFTKTAGTSGANNDEDPEELVDNDNTTKWCVTSLGSPTYIEFNYGSAFIPEGYSLTTGNDNASNPGRNPKSWVIKAKRNLDDSWTPIATVTNDNILQDVNRTTFNYNISNTDAYQYFRFEISAVQSGSIMQLSELRFVGKADTSAPPTIALSPSSATVLTGHTETLTATYDNVTGTPTITYSSSNNNVATVSGSGTTATVTGVAPGTATITASMTYQGTTYTATCAITVENPSYCTPTFSNNSDYITKFTLGDIDNATGFSPSGYGNYTTLSTSLGPGVTATASLTSSSGSGTHAAAVWIDFNDNYVFENSERVGTKGDIGPSTTVSIDLAIPSDAAVGNHRLRVVYQYNVAATNINPCASASYGEGEDYTVNITTEPSITLAPETATLRLGSTLDLTATVRNVSDPTITYTSSDNTIATVSGNGTTATVTGVAEGTVTITASMSVGGETYTARSTIVVQDMPLRVGDGTNATYLTWEEFAAGPANGTTYSGKTVFLEKDITTNVKVSGNNWTSGNAFRGTFDGQGYTITLDMNSTETQASLFNYTFGATIKNLKVDGTITSTGSRAAGFVGLAQSGITFENCISDVTITSTSVQNGGFVGDVVNGATFKGCAFTGKLLGETSHDNGGFVGHYHYDSYTRTYTNCVFAPSEVTMGTSGSYTFCRLPNTTDDWRTTITNCYYTESFGTEQGKQAYTITGGTGITVELNGLTDTYTYSVSSIAGYSSSNKGMRYNGTILAGNGDNVSLNLNGSDEYQADHGTLAGSGSSYSLTMAASNTVISGISCAVPTNLRCDRYTPTSATLSWTRGGDETAWQVKYWPTNLTEPDDLAGYTMNVSANPYTLTNLTQGQTYYVKVRAKCDENDFSDWSTPITVTPGTMKFIFTNNGGTGDSKWDTDTNWSPVGLPTIDDDVEIRANAIIRSGYTALANNISFYYTNPGDDPDGSITIEDGGQLQHNNEDVVVTVKRYIAPYGSANLGYKIISFPVSGIYQEDECIEGLLTANPYDFYTFDYNNLEENVYLEWVHVSNNDVLDPYKGFLYASQNGTTISVKGVVAPSVNQNHDLDYVEGVAPFNGWQLVGNPFVCNAYLTANGGNLDFYEIEDDAQAGYAEFVLNDNTVAIPPMGGVMVWLHDDDNLVYSRTAPSKGPGILNMDVNKASMRGTTMLDRARVRFGEGRNLKKLQLNPRHTKLYIPEDGNDFSVYYAEGAGTIPVNFKAQDNGSYTLSFSTEDVSFNYLHLIDNMNGNDVDLLQTPYYTFDAKSTDFASRFTLVFATGSSTGSDTFAFFNNGVWIINNPSTGSGAEATLQVVDVLGHILSSETISGSCSKAINVAPGVYMLRLVNGNDVKVQKIVVR